MQHQRNDLKLLSFLFINLFYYYYFLFLKGSDIPVGDAEPGKQLEIKGHCCDDGK